MEPGEIEKTLLMGLKDLLEFFHSLTRDLLEVT